MYKTVVNLPLRYQNRLDFQKHRHFHPRLNKLATGFQTWFHRDVYPEAVGLSPAPVILTVSETLKNIPPC